MKRISLMLINWLTQNPLQFSNFLLSWSPKILVMDTLVDTSVDTLGRQCENQDFGDAKCAGSAQIAQLTKLYNDLEKIIISCNNIENVKQLYRKLCDRFEQFKSAHLYCLNLCTKPDAANEMEQRFDRCATNFAEIQDRYAQWISGRNRPMPEENDGCPSVSCASSRKSSTLMSSRSKYGLHKQSDSLRNSN